MYTHCRRSGLSHFSLQDVLDLPALLDGVAEDDRALARVRIQLDGLQERGPLVIEHLPHHIAPHHNPSRNIHTHIHTHIHTSTVCCPDLVRALCLHPGAAAVHQQLLHVRGDAVQTRPATAVGQVRTGQVRSGEVVSSPADIHDVWELGLDLRHHHVR